MVRASFKIHKISCRYPQKVFPLYKESSYLSSGISMRRFPFLTAYSIASIIEFDSCILPFSMSQRGLSGTFLLSNSKEMMPIQPNKNINLQCYVSPTSIVRSEAKAPPKCQVPSIAIFTLPLYFGGKN